MTKEISTPWLNRMQLQSGASSTKTGCWAAGLIRRWRHLRTNSGPGDSWR